MYNVNFLTFQAFSLKNAFWRKSFTCKEMMVFKRRKFAT